MNDRHSEASARALRALTREAADLPLPEIDWDRVEQRLLSAVERAPVLRSAPAPVPLTRQIDVPRRPGSVWAVALAAAAAVALVAAPRSSRSPALAETNSIDQETQRVAGDSIPREAAESGKEPLSYHRAGMVSFTLAPESRVEMASSDSQSMTVNLIHGSIHADVTPRPSGEVFAVEVEHTRIAAHGTSFTVTRHDDQAMVEIEHGSVAVGPVGHPGSTQGWLLVGPDRALFSLDGAKEARWLGPPATRPPSKAIATTPVASPIPAIAAPTAAGHVPTIEPGPAPRPPPALAPAPTPSASEENRAAAPEAPLPAERQGDATAAILSGLEACYERQVSSLGVRFTIQSSLSLTVLPNGTVREGVFTPPLSPTLMTCAREAISSARFPRSESIKQISVPVRLSRAEGE